jgi:hypothetical protein
MARVIKLKESDITKIVKKILKEKRWEMPDMSGNPDPYYPDFDNPFGNDDPWTWNTGGGGGGTTWGGNKGDKSKTHPGKRDYEGRGNKKISATEVAEVFQSKGVMDVIKKYEKFYNTIKPEDRKGVATPDEVRRKGMEIIEDEGGDTPAASWIFLGWLAISVIVYVASHYWPWQCC